VQYDSPTPEASWQATLDAIAPPGGRLSWLKLVWIAGDEHEPVNRWGIFQMLPLDRAPTLVRDDLRGPSPRVRGRYDRVLGRFIPDPLCNVNLLQWQLYQQTGCYGKLYWIVQGSNGGHKRQFNRMESVVSRMNGGPDQPPLIGDLPYARPDNRTFDKIAKMDLVRTYSYLLDRASKAQHDAVLDMHDKNILEQMRGQVWKWLESQVAEAVQENPAGARALWDSGENRSFNQAALEAASV
jgi:hypothetical protein